MKAKRRDIWPLLLILGTCAILFGTLGRKSNQIVVETRFERPLSRSTWVNRGTVPLFEASNLEKWGRGAEKEVVFDSLGDPDYTFQLFHSDYYVWRQTVRYDWDVKDEYQGKYITIGFSSGEEVNSVAINRELPLDSKPYQTR
jgi:outer membrane protein assembly factor BamE (lipoprotein component of BamABCDE complex)